MLNVFEAFAGYGSQRMALKNIGITHNVVGISEIDKDAILSYASIHTDFLQEKTQNIPALKEDMIAELEHTNVPLDYRTFENKARKLKLPQLQDFHLANKLTKNFGDISRIDPKGLPDFDFFTYSFPCQDISVAGYQNGLNTNSGTRSSLLWECCKIIEYKRPKYLMMENVKNLIGKNHIHNFHLFLEYLTSLGYTNSWKVLNAKDFGVPQNRERVFCISELNASTPFEFPSTIPLTVTMNDWLETNVDKKYYLSGNQTTDFIIQQDVCYCLDANYWKGTFLKDFLSKKRRQVVTGKQLSNSTYAARRLTPYETWKFMGCSESDFKKAQQVVSNTALYRQAGNSIVVPVLEAIFKNLFK
ncbi:MAG: DNA cytosine methyltransferase [Brevinema sp.]